MRAPYHVHMNFVADYRHIMTAAKRCNCGQLFPRPDFAGRILRATQQQNCVFRFCQRRFQRGHIAVPATRRFLHRHGNNGTLVAFNGFIKGIVSRGMNHHAVARRGPYADQLRDHINDRRPIHYGFGINLTVKALPEPVRHGSQKFVIFPAAVAKHAVVDALVQRIGNTGSGSEIHIRDGEGQQVGSPKTVSDIIPLGTPGAVSIHDGRKIKHDGAP